jgi:hypothetical protein
MLLRQSVAPLRAQLRGTSPPQVSGPKRDERFAIRGAKTQKSSLRLATLFLETLSRISSRQFRKSLLDFLTQKVHCARP